MRHPQNCGDPPGRRKSVSKICFGLFNRCIKKVVKCLFYIVKNHNLHGTPDVSSMPSNLSFVLYMLPYLKFTTSTLFLEVIKNIGQ